MKVLVCIKQVPDMESKFKINTNTKWFDENDLAYRINEYDEYAIEQAVQLKVEITDENNTLKNESTVRIINNTTNSKSLHDFNFSQKTLRQIEEIEKSK